MTSFVLLGKHSSLQHCILKKKDTPNYCKRWSRRKKWVGGMSSQRDRYSQCIHENIGEESILQEWIDMQFLHRKSRSLNFAVYRLRAKMCSLFLMYVRFEQGLVPCFLCLFKNLSKAFFTLILARCFCQGSEGPACKNLILK